MANRFKRVFLSTFAAALSMSCVWSQACKADEYLQPAACGSAKSEFFQTSSGTVVTLNRKGTMWKGTNSAQGDKCGLILFLGDKKHIMRGDRDTEIVFDSITDEVKNNTTVTLIFKPQFSQPDLITVTKPLKDLRFGAWTGHPIAKVGAKEFLNREGVPDLKKLMVKYTGNQSMIVRHINVDCEQNSWSSGDIRLTPTLDCSAFDQQK